MAIRVNTQPISTFVFPGGECHVNLAAIPLSGHATVTALLADSDDILRLLLVVNALRQNDPSMTIDLILPYVPYARQDRVCNAGEAASIQVMAGLINGLRCRSVTIHDPHSDVAPALLERCIVVTQAELLLRNPLAGRIAAEGWTLPAPDAGAEKKRAPSRSR